MRRGLLSERDEAIIQTVMMFGQAATDQLLRLHFSEPHTSPTSRRQRTCRALKRLVKWKQLGRIERAVGGAYGGSSNYIYIPPLSRARVHNPHTLDITELYVRLKESKENIEVLIFDPEPLSWDQYGNTELRPDAKVRVRTATGTHQYYLELDRATEYAPQLSAKMRRYISAWRQRSGSFFPIVLFVVPDDARRRMVLSVMRRQEVPEMFHVCLFDEAVDILTR